VAVAVVAACGGDDPAPSDLRVNPSTIVMGEAETLELGAFYVVEGSSERAGDGVTWSVTDGAVASVTGGADGGATLLALAPGMTTVTAAAAGLSGTATLAVRAVPEVAETSPTDGATGVGRPVDVELTFSVAMEPTSLRVSTAAGACDGTIHLSRDEFATCEAFDAAVALDGSGAIATVVPAALLGDTTYKLRITTGARSLEGQPLAAAFTHATGFRTSAPEPCATGLVISQLYGGGGGTGSPFTHDFIELHNAGTQPRSLAGMALQYAGSGGTGVWGAQALPSVMVPAGGYFLVQEAAGAGTPGPLPAPDFVPANPITLSPTAGKVALTSTVTPLDGVCPGANVVDRVGYGGANCFEGAAPAPAPSNTTAVQRRSLGCVDAGENGTDFVTAAPAPRNGMTAPSACVCLR
jgi:hypothetical protein